MTIKLYPQPSLFDESVAAVRAATPVLVSSFYLTRPYLVPWSAEPTTFILETDEPSARHEIIINRSEVVRFVPGFERVTLSLQLAKGANRLEASTSAQSAYITVAATAVESWLSTLGREIYLSVNQRLDDIEAHLASPWTTRLAAHLVPFSAIFIRSRMPRVHQTRLAILASVAGQGRGDGVRTMASAVSYSTPWVSRAHVSEFNVPGQFPDYAGVTSHPTQGEALGRVLDLWYPNLCLGAHQALFRLAMSVGAADVPAPKPISLVDKTDVGLLLRYNGQATEFHSLDAMAPECSDIERDVSCFANVRTFVLAESVIDVMMNSPQLPFDEVIENPLGFGFWDMGFALDGSSAPDGGPGLGGDDDFDTVDLDDPFGDGFAGFSLSRRMDYACLDTRLQRGQRMTKYVAPLTSTSAFTPEPSIMTEGVRLRVDAATGAPAPNIGTSVLWAVADLTYLYEGDYLRFEAPDTEIAVASAWPVFDAANIVKTDTTATYTPSGSEKIITAPAGFFEKRFEARGLRVGASDLYCIVRCSDDGTTATIAGNPTIPPGGPLIVSVYEPVRDRTDESEADDALEQDVAGATTYEITLASPLLATLADGALLSYRSAPRASGPWPLASPLVAIASDVLPLPGDFLYFTTTLFVTVSMATESGMHHTTGYKIYDVLLDDPSPSVLTDNQPLYVVRANPCWPMGNPVTPLFIVGLSPPAHLTP